MSEGGNSRRDIGGHPVDTARRRFVATGAAAAGAMLADWRGNRAFAQANAATVGANDRIGIGIIGVGGMGNGHLGDFMQHADEWNTRIVAVCDIYDRRKERAKERSNGAKVYHDYTEMLADDDVDAVLIATPEHWHSRQAVDAMEAGKDVYLEKPMTRYLDEATLVHDTALRTGRVLQVGSQYASEAKWQAAHELMPKIGKPIWSQTSYNRNSIGGEWNYGIDKDAGPDNVDWARFVGPAPEQPWSPERYFRWRKFWDFSSGMYGDLMPHVLYPLLLVLGAELPARVMSAGGTYVHKQDREVTDTSHALIEYPSEHTLLLVSTAANEQGVPPTIFGHEATMYLSGGNVVEIRPERPFAEEAEGGKFEVPPTPNMSTVHRRNWVDCMRSRETPNCGPELAYAGMVAVAMAEEAFRQRNVMAFDPETRTAKPM